MPSPQSFSHYVFVDFENVPSVDLAVVAGKPVHVTLLIGKQQKHLEVSLVRQALQHADQVELIEVGVAGRNALDLVLAAYLGRASLRHPNAEFTVVSRDRDFDPLITHLQANHVRVARQADFFTRAPRSGRVIAPNPPPPLAREEPRDRRRDRGVAANETARTALAPARAPADTPPATRRPRRAASDAAPAMTRRVGADDNTGRPQRGPRTQPPARPAVAPDRWEKLVARLTGGDGPLPRNEARFLHHLRAHFGHKLSEAGARELLDDLIQRGFVKIDEKQRLTYPHRGDTYVAPGAL